MTTPCVVYIDNTNVLEVRGLAELVTGDFINDATVTMTLKDANGEELAGQDWPWSMAYLADSDGTYRGIIKDTVEMQDGVEYFAHIDATGGPDQVGHWEFAFKAKIRRN